jgi:hypothetical protein
MTIEDIVQKAFDRPPDCPQVGKADVEAFCQREQITTTEFLERFARYIVEGYVAGRFTWLSCDTAMNGLSGLMSQYVLMPDYPWGVFLAFDAGEYHPKTPNLTPDEVTRPLIDELVAKYRAT